MSAELPLGWVTTTLGEVAEVHDHRRIPLNQAQRAARPGPYPYYGANGQVGTVDDFLFEGDHILLAEDGGYFDDPFRPNAYAVSGRFWVNNHAHILRASEAIDHWYLLHALNATDLMPYVSGTTRLKLTQADMRRIPILLPPLAEQRRIVARIEALFARTRQARDDLLRIAPLAARYKQESHRKLLDAAERGWATTTVGDVADLLQYGSSAKTNGDASGVPVLRMGNILDGELELSNLKYLPRDHHEFPALLLKPGDVLFNRTNSAELVGKSAVYEGTPAPCSYASYLIRLRVRGIDPTIVAAYINSPLGRAWAAASTSQQVGQANINGAKLRALAVPSIPLEQQPDVVRALRAATRLGKRLAAEAARALALLDHLERSILNRAFRGELVPQDPHEEPAAASLARLRADAPASPPRRGRRRAA